MNSTKYQEGFSLLELLMAIPLSLFLFSLLFILYFSCRQSIFLQTTLNDVRHTAQSAIDILRTDIHLAGYIGCPKLDSNFPIIHYPPYVVSPAHKLLGNDAEIMVRHATVPPVSLLSMHDQSTLNASDEIHFSAGDVLLISDCHKAEVFRAKFVYLSNHMQQIILASPLHDYYKTKAEISRMEINKYFIDRHRTSSFLMLEDINHRKHTLLDGVQNMRVTYFIQQAEKIILTQSKDIDDWSKVRGVLIELDIVSSTIKKTWYTSIALQN